MLIKPSRLNSLKPSPKLNLHQTELDLDQTQIHCNPMGTGEARKGHSI